MPEAHLLCSLYCLEQDTDRLASVGGQDVKSKRSIGIHCCTMTISMEPLDEAPKVLEAEKRAAGIPEDAFITLRHGAMLQTANGSDLNKPSLMIIHGSS